MRALRFLALLLMLPVAAAQGQVLPRESTPARVAAATITASDGTKVSVPVFQQTDMSGNVVSSAGVNCASSTATLSGAGQSITLSCPNSGAYAITVTPTALVGSLSFASGNGAPKRVTRNGQAPLQISTVPFAATDTGNRYYATNGGNSLVITLSAYTSGSVAVTISATGGALYPIPIGEQQTSALVALLNGRGFTGGFPGGTLNVANGNLACLTIANPAGSGVRAIFEGRLMSVDVIMSQQPPRYYVVNNATTGLPTTAATINNRGAGGTSAMTMTYGSLTALPTGGSTALGGYVPTGGQIANPPLEKTLEPGTNTTMCINGVNATATLGATSSPSVIFGWREQAVN